MLYFYSFKTVCIAIVLVLCSNNICKSTLVCTKVKQVSWEIFLSLKLYCNYIEIPDKLNCTNMCKENTSCDGIVYQPAGFENNSTKCGLCTHVHNVYDNGKIPSLGLKLDKYFFILNKNLTIYENLFQQNNNIILASSCKELKDKFVHLENGIYKIGLQNGEFVYVYCIMSVSSGHIAVYGSIGDLKSGMIILPSSCQGEKNTYFLLSKSQEKSP